MANDLTMIPISYHQHMPTSPGQLLREARTRAGLTQRALARRARTSQSVIARIEGGVTSPSWKTLTRLLTAAGFDLHAQLDTRPTAGSHMLRDVARILSLTPEQRLDEVKNLNRFIYAARRA